MPCWDHAAELAKRLPAWSVGLHFNLTWAAPAPRSVPTLVDAQGQAPWRSETPAAADRWILPGNLYNQYNRLCRSGIAPSHVDGHQGIHALDNILAVLLDFAARLGLPLRLAPHARERIKRRGPSPPAPSSISSRAGGYPPNFERLLRECRAETAEFRCRPGMVDADLENLPLIPGSGNGSWQWYAPTPGRHSRRSTATQLISFAQVARRRLKAAEKTAGHGQKKHRACAYYSKSQLMEGQKCAFLVDGVTIEMQHWQHYSAGGHGRHRQPRCSRTGPGRRGVGRNSQQGRTRIVPGVSRPCSPSTPDRQLLLQLARLPNKKVIHCLPPAGSCNRSVALLEKCYLQSPLLTDEHGLTSVAFPPVLGFPGHAAGKCGGHCPARGAQAAPLLRNVRRVRFVLFDRHTFLHYRNLMAANPESVIHTTITG